MLLYLKVCPCMNGPCYNGCVGCDNPVCSQSENIFVFSKYNSYWNAPLVFDSMGEYSEVDFEYGPNTDLSGSCSVQFQNKFYVFGGGYQPLQVIDYWSTSIYTRH